VEWQAAPDWVHRPALDGVHDKRNRARRLEHVVHRLGCADPVSPLERLAECDQAIGAGRGVREVFCDGLDPTDIPDAALAGSAVPLGQHCCVGV
jgi:hypothetical protein